MKYRIKIIRECEFEVVLPAQSKADAIRIVTEKALDYDDRDMKSTKIVSIHEVQENPVLDPFN